VPASRGLRLVLRDDLPCAVPDRGRVEDDGLPARARSRLAPIAGRLSLLGRRGGGQRGAATRPGLGPAPSSHLVRLGARARSPPRLPRPEQAEATAINPAVSSRNPGEGAFMNAIPVNAPGGPEVMRYEDTPEPTPKAGEATVKVDAAGINYVDVYQRSGQYKLALPLTLGLEAGGTVTAIGPNVTEVKVGDKVAYSDVPGAYAQYAAVPASRLVV